MHWEVTLQRYKLNEALWLPDGERWEEGKLGKGSQIYVTEDNQTLSGEHEIEYRY